MTRGSESSCPCSEKHSEQWKLHIAAVVADTHASRRPSDEDDGKEHSRLTLQQSCVSLCGQTTVAAKQVFELLPTKYNASDSRFLLFFVNSRDPSIVEFCLAQQSNSPQRNPINFSACFSCSLVRMMRIVQESGLLQASPRLDVDEAPDAKLLLATEMMDFHDPIELLNSEDYLARYEETLPNSEADSGQRDDSPAWYLLCSTYRQSHPASI